MTSHEEQSIADVRRRYGAYVASKRTGTHLQRNMIEIVLTLIGLLLVFCGILILPAGIVGIVLGLGALSIAAISLFYRRKWDVGQAKLVHAGIPVSCMVVTADARLFEPGPISLSCLVLFSFEPAGNNLEYLSNLSLAIAGLTRNQQTDKDLRFIAELVLNGCKEKYRRVKLPLSGPMVYCGELRVERSCLPHGYITEWVLPGIALPGEKGPLELLPWQVAAGQDINYQGN